MDLPKQEDFEKGLMTYRPTLAEAMWINIAVKDCELMDQSQLNPQVVANMCASAFLMGWKLRGEKP